MARCNGGVPEGAAWEPGTAGREPDAAARVYGIAAHGTGSRGDNALKQESPVPISFAPAVLDRQPVHRLGQLDVALGQPARIVR